MPPTVIIAPVYEDMDSVSELARRLARNPPRDCFVVCIDDGSVGQPTAISALEEAGIQGAVLYLRRNVGHQRAIATGLAWVAEHLPSVERLVIMDSDGEDRPECIPDLLDMLDGGSVDVVVAERGKRAESAGFRFFYLVYRTLFRALAGRKIRFGNFMAMNNLALHRLASMGETGLHVAGSVLVSRLRWQGRAIDRGKRYAGQSKMGFVSLVLHGFKAFMVFAEDVLVRVGVACLLVAGTSVVGMGAAVILKSLGIATPGWFSVALGVLVLMFMQTGAIALMTLMMAGIMRGQTVLPIDHRRLIARIVRTNQTASDEP
jgi:hypothetical protein